MTLTSPITRLNCKESAQFARSGFFKKLARWYRRHGRHDLPWRLTEDPYAIYLSEVMLQQTQVATVAGSYYPRFLKSFPTFKALAEAKEDRVLKHWQGLGYYRRARHLHAAAKQAKGAMPSNLEGLLALPGIGRNTAHAVLAFAFRKAFPVMEANVKRALCRIFALKRPADSELWQRAFQLMDESGGAKDPWTYNQAMMDLGASICTPKAPQCLLCPASSFCQGKETPEHFPEKIQKRAVPIRKRHIFVIEDASGSIHVIQRKGEFLAGLYGFPESEVNTYKTYPKESFRNIGSIRQVYSHFRLEGEVLYLQIPGRKSGAEWVKRDKIHSLPLSKADLKVLDLLVS